MSTTTNRYLAYPAAVGGITRATSGGAAWSFSAYTEVVPASTITSDFYIAGLTWCWPTPLAAVDTTYQWIIELATGEAASEELIIQVPASVRSDTLVGYVPSNMVIFPEPKYVAANTRISVRIAYSDTTTAKSLTGIKILYQMA